MDSTSPPPYAEAISISPTTSASISSMSYIASRPYTVTTPHSLITHKLDISNTTFPESFLTRDVTEQDWQSFITYLVGRGSKQTKAEERRINFVLTEWNDEFFEPRGLKVALEKKKEEGKDGFGFKLGGATVGVSWNDADGYGIKMGPVLFGVKTGSSAKEKEPEKAKEEKSGEATVKENGLGSQGTVEPAEPKSLVRK